MPIYDYKSMICSFSSSDTNYSALSGVYFDDIGVAVATDKFRIFITKKLYSEKMTGKLFRADKIIESNYYEELDGEFPNWKQIINSMKTENYENFFEVTVPEWMNLFSNSSTQIPFSIDYRDLDNAKLIVGKHQSDMCVGIDGRFLSPFAGKSIWISVDSACSPFLITSKECCFDKRLSLLEQLCSENWSAVILPIRVDPKESSDQDYIYV